VERKREWEQWKQEWWRWWKQQEWLARERQELAKWEVEWRLGQKEWTELGRSKSETRGDKLGRWSDKRKSLTDLPTLPDLLLLLQALHERLYPDASSFCPLLVKVDSLALDLSEGARRVLIISSPWWCDILRPHHPELTAAR
jgi:hypothetical protein